MLIAQAGASERPRVLDHRDCRPGSLVAVGLSALSGVGSSFGCFICAFL